MKTTIITILACIVFAVCVAACAAAGGGPPSVSVGGGCTGDFCGKTYPQAAAGMGFLEDNSTSGNIMKRSTGTIENATAGTDYVAPQTTIDGSAHVHLTAAQMSNPSCHVSNYGQTTADVNIGLPTAAANLSCLFTVSTAQSNHWGVLADTNDAIYIIAADGTISAKGTDGAAAVLVAAQVGQSFACWSIKTGASAWDWACKAISIGSSTFEAHAAF